MTVTVAVSVTLGHEPCETVTVYVVVSNGVTVNVEEQQYTSAGMEWKPVKSLRLDNPGQLLTEYLTSGRRIIIEESGKVV